MHRQRTYAPKRMASKSLSVPAAKRSKYTASKKRGERSGQRLDFGRSYNLAINRGNTVPRPVFGTEYTCRLVYFERGFGLTGGGGVGATGTHVFSANGLYDPDITGVGHQPAGFDQMMQWFDHYTVKSSKVSVSFHNASPTYYNFVGIYFSDRSNTVTDPREVIENGKGVYTKLNLPGSAGDMTQLDVMCSVSKFLGRPNVMDEDDLRGNVTSNPTEEVYIHIWQAAQSATAASDNGVGFEIRIEYYVTFTEPKLIPIS